MLSYIEISKENLLENIKTLKTLLNKNTQVAAVIKGNAYGHGQNEVAKIIEKEIDFFQVDDIEELKLLRKVSSKKTFVFGYVPEKSLEELVKLNGILGVYDLKRIKILNEIGRKLDKKIKIHIKIDALLGRQGILPDQVGGFAKKLKSFRFIKVDGVYAHFANIEDTSDPTHARKQAIIYRKALEKFNKHGFENIKTHIAATSGVFVSKLYDNNFDIARLGIGIYGLWPSEDLKKRYSNGTQLKPVLRWVTHIAQVKTVPSGFPLGYGLTYITSRPTKVAIIPQGYADGYDRGLTNVGEVLIRKKRCRILGRVAMNMFVVDVSKLKIVRAEDEVVLLGKQGKEEITAEEIANRIFTINYEVVTRIDSNLARKLI